MKITDLTLREKILQTMLVRVENDGFYSEKVGGIFIGGSVIDDPDNVEVKRTIETSIRYKEHADIPIFISSDFENGCGKMVPGLSELPMNMGVAAANDEELAYNCGKMVALEARSVGANWNFAPACDMSIHPRNLMNVRTFGDDVDVTSKLTLAMVKGMQDNGLSACVKHFPGGGLDWRDSHMVTLRNPLSKEEWWKISGKPFMDSINAGVRSIMTGFGSLPSYQTQYAENGFIYPAALSKEIVTNLLKGEMGFKGVVITDAIEMGGAQGFFKTKLQTEIEAFNAGNDIILWPSNNERYIEGMIDAVENGYIKMERLDDAVSRILDMKEKSGMFNETNHVYDLTEEDKKFINDIQVEASDKSITLRRDKAGFFPLKAEDNKKIAVVAIAHFEPFNELGVLLADELKNKGFDITYYDVPTRLEPEDAEQYDIIIYACFGRPHRPIGFLDYTGRQAVKVTHHNKFAQDKALIVSFASPYYDTQYFERALTYVNAYTSAPSVVKSFVKAATGEIEFGTFSPVKL